MFNASSWSPTLTLTLTNWIHPSVHTLLRWLSMVIKDPCFSSQPSSSSILLWHLRVFFSPYSLYSLLSSQMSNQSSSAHIHWLFKILIICKWRYHHIGIHPRASLLYNVLTWKLTPGLELQPKLWCGCQELNYLSCHLLLSRVHISRKPDGKQSWNFIPHTPTWNSGTQFVA